jgi:hypothetical protein
MQAVTTHPGIPYPVRVEGRLERPSRWLWLVKWLLALPHYVVLAFLWLAFFVLMPVVAVAVVFTGRYPRRIFEFNLGVMRWSWRVSFYAYGANGTDRYPPFTLADVPEYPARLEIPYPEQRRGWSLIGWWLAGAPQYLIAAVIFGGGGLFGWSGVNYGSGMVGGGGLTGLLVLVAAIVLLVRGEYPRSIFDLVLGLNRWVLRVGAYAALMTREYPPFRLDSGEHDPGTIALAGALPIPVGNGVREAAGGGVALFVFGGLVTLVSLTAVAAGGTAIVFDQTQRDAGGYVSTNTAHLSTSSYALVTDSYRAGTAADIFVTRDLLGRVVVRTQSSQSVFVGIGAASAVGAYLAGVRHELAPSFDSHHKNFRLVAGGAPATAPTAAHFWVAHSVGSGMQVLTWMPRNGDWRIVMMNADGSPAVASDASIGAQLPHLLAVGLAALGLGLAAALLATGLIYAGSRSRSRSRSRSTETLDAG